MSRIAATPVEVEWCPELPIFASDAFLQTVSDEYGWIGGVDTEGRRRCVLPYTVIRKAGFCFVRFRSSTIAVGEELRLDEEKAFLNSVVEHFRSTGADMILPSGNTAVFRTYPDHAHAAPYGTVLKDLEQSEDALMAEIRATHRQNIRKAVHAGVHVKQGQQYVEAAYDMVAETMLRSGEKWKPRREINRTVGALGQWVKVFIAEHQGVIQGCMVSPFSQYAAYSCYAGSLASPVRGAMQLLHWEAIRDFRSLGVQRFDFQGVRINPEKGSKQEGIMHYKQGFGGRFVRGYIWKYPLRKLKGLAYAVGVRLLVKGGDVVDQERHKLEKAATI